MKLIYRRSDFEVNRSEQQHRIHQSEEPSVYLFFALKFSGDI